MYDSRQKITQAPNRTTIAERPVVVIPGNEGGEAGGLMVQFPDWQSVKPFDIDVEVVVAGQVVSTTRLHVNATARRSQ
jgi:hypothetical protein